MPLTLSGTNGVSGVDGSASTPANRGSDTNTGIVYGTDTVQIATGGTTAVTVDSSQNVGIGVTPSAWDASYKAVSVNGFALGSQTASGGGELSKNSYVASGGANTYVGNGFATKYEQVSGAHKWFTAPSGTAGGTITFTQAMTLDSSGNLLVGTTSAGGGSGNQFRVFSPTAGKPAGEFYVNAASSTATAGVSIAKYDNNSTTSQIFVTFAINQFAAGSGYITANGANAATFTSSSDARLKENIVALDSQLENICLLKPSEFDFKDGSGHQIGFIAQEMAQVYPDCVAEDNRGMLLISGWSKTEARLVKAIQELSAKLDAAEARIAALEAK